MSQQSSFYKQVLKRLSNVANAQQSHDQVSSVIWAMWYTILSRYLLCAQAITYEQALFKLETLLIERYSIFTIKYFGFL